MTDKMDVTQEEVFRAADAMAADGLQPSVRLLRVQLGERGSHSSITKHLRAWRGQREQEASGYLPAELTRLIASHVQSTTAQKTKELAARLKIAEADMEEMAKRAEAAEVRVVGLHADLSATSTDLDRAQLQARDLTSLLDGARAECRQISAELRAAAEKAAQAAAQAESHKAEAGKAELRAGFLEKELAGVCSQIETWRAQSVEREGILAAKQAAHDSLAKRLDESTQELSRAARREAELNHAMQHTLADLRAQLETERQARMALEQSVISMAMRPQSLRGRSRKTDSSGQVES